MKRYELRKNDEVIISRCYVAKSFFNRFMGLMGRRGISPDETILFPKCNSIHTFFMRFPIDVLLLDENWAVVEILEGMKPWRMIAPRLRAKHVAEMRSHRAKELGIQVGDVLFCSGV